MYILYIFQNAGETSEAGPPRGKHTLPMIYISLTESSQDEQFTIIIILN